MSDVTRFSPPWSGAIRWRPISFCPSSMTSRAAWQQGLQATALVHEAYLRLLDGGQPQDWNSRGHFFAAAAEAKRRILVNHARTAVSRRRLGFGGVAAAGVQQDAGIRPGASCNRRQFDLGVTRQRFEPHPGGYDGAMRRFALVPGDEILSCTWRGCAHLRAFRPV